MGVGCVGFLGIWEREREGGTAGDKKPSFLYLHHVQRKKKMYSVVKTTPF
jgi:hypothetical protein